MPQHDSLADASIAITRRGPPRIVLDQIEGITERLERIADKRASAAPPMPRRDASSPDFAEAGEDGS